MGTGVSIRKFWRFIGLLIFIFILLRLDWGEMRINLSKANYFLIFIAVLLNVPQVWLKAVRWRMLLGVQNIKITNNDAFTYYCNAVYLGIITPGRIGEVAKAFFLKNKGMTTLSHALSSVVVDRGFDLYFLYFVAMVGVLILQPWKGAELFGCIGLLSCALPFVVFVYKDSLEQLSLMLYKKALFPMVGKRVQGSTQEFVAGVRQIIGIWLWKPLALTCTSYIIFFGQCFLVAISLDIQINFFVITLIMAMTNIFSFLPISVAGLGTRETALLFLLAPQGLLFDEVIAFSVGIFFVFYLGGALLGGGVWLVRPVQLTSDRNDTTHCHPKDVK